MVSPSVQFDIEVTRPVCFPVESSQISAFPEIEPDGIPAQLIVRYLDPIDGSFFLQPMQHEVAVGIALHH